MSFLRAARAALAGQVCLRRLQMAVALASIAILPGLFTSCGNSYSRTAPSHSAYVSIPAKGNVLLMSINGATGTMTVSSQTPQILNASTTGLALLPSKKFLYAVNSAANSISIFSVASDGTLTLTGVPTVAGNGPYIAAIDPSGKYLLVTNSFGSNGSGGDVSVYSIDGGSGALTEVAGSPFFANASPSDILITPSGNYVYVSNPVIGAVTAFSFSNGVLSQLSTSPVFSGQGATGLAMDANGKFLYVANASAPNVSPFTTTTGNISGFNIDPSSGALTPILGSPFVANGGTGPTQVAVDPSGKFLYATTPGTGDSIWAFTISATSGQLASVTGSPFSVAAGALFAVFDPTGGYFYIGSSTPAIEGYTYNPSTGILTNIPGMPLNTGSAPGKMVFCE